MTGRDVKTIMVAAPYTGNGVFEMGLVINKKWDFNELSSKVHIQYKVRLFTGKTVGDYVAHEMAHIMTFQHCKTLDEHFNLKEKLGRHFVTGASRYTDKTGLGSETLAEVYANYQNGEKMPLKAKEMIWKYIERWRK